MSDDREQVLELYKGLRVTDVVDAMDGVGYFDRGQMSRDIRPLWRDIETFKHRIYGIAHTVRFIPTDKPVPKLGNSLEGPVLGFTTPDAKSRFMSASTSNILHDRR